MVKTINEKHHDVRKMKGQKQQLYRQDKLTTKLHSNEQGHQIKLQTGKKRKKEKEVRKK